MIIKIISEGKVDISVRGKIAPPGSQDTGTIEQPEITREEQFIELGLPINIKYLKNKNELGWDIKVPSNVAATITYWEKNTGEATLHITNDQSAFIIGSTGQTISVINKAKGHKE